MTTVNGHLERMNKNMIVNQPFYVSKNYPGDDERNEKIVATFSEFLDATDFALSKSLDFTSLVWRAKRDVEVDDYFYQGGKRIK